VNGTAAQELHRLLARQRPRVVAHLARSLGLPHLALAEDALQTAALRALEIWPVQGVPANPAGWLYRVARNEAIDSLRVAGRHEAWPDDEAAAAALLPAPDGHQRFAGELSDDELALLFAACHPALPQAQQVSLALVLFTGLDHAALSAALLCTPAALAQRLQRARETLAPQSLRLPAGHELPPRRDAVLTVLALAFHAGCRARVHTRGDRAALALCWEAIRLARSLAAHPVAGHPDADALAAMLLLHGARLNGQLDEAGHIVLLPGQPRERWDAGMVKMGLAHLQASQRATVLSRWHLLAGIASEHALAGSYAGTDWPAIVRFYESLLVIDPSPAPRLAHAIALAEAGEPLAALARLHALLPEVPSVLRPHALAALARAHERQGDVGAARGWLQQAVAAAQPAEARVLAERLEKLERPGQPGPASA
jgi:RNA polymerase sigma-70 factor, ECF subfamily